MHTDARPKLPFKGPILIYASVVLALGGLARLAEDTLARLQLSLIHISEPTRPY